MLGCPGPFSSSLADDDDDGVDYGLFSNLTHIHAHLSVQPHSHFLEVKKWARANYVESSMAGPGIRIVTS